MGRFEKCKQEPNISILQINCTRLKTKCCYIETMIGTNSVFSTDRHIIADLNGGNHVSDTHGIKVWKRL